MSTKKITLRLSGILICAALLVSTALAAGEGANRPQVWLDCYTGEAINFEKMIDDLATVDIVYLGELHTLHRHHLLQQKIVEALQAKGRRVLLGMEQLETFTAPDVDRYNQGALTFDELATQIQWKKRWNNYEDYRGLVEAVHQGGGRIIPLNARAEVVRSVGRKGLSGLSQDESRQIGKNLLLDSEEHRKLVTMRLQVHAKFTDDMLNKIYEAQVVRDETMAASASRELRNKKDRDIVVVVCGSVHCAYGLGIPQRVQRRLSGTVSRIVTMSESGDLVLSKAMKAHARKIEITHDQLRFLKRPKADYHHFVFPKKKE